MASRITITKAVNGYIVCSDYALTKEENIICFKNMEQVVAHLNECFVKPFKDLKLSDGI